MKEYDLRELMNGVTNQERITLAYNIIMGFDKGVIGQSCFPGVRFTKEGVCNDDALIEAYEKLYPVTDGYWYAVRTYEHGDSWIYMESLLLDECVQRACEISDDYPSVEVMACHEAYDDQCILYIGTPNDNTSEDGANTSIGCMRIAEFQDIMDLDRHGYYKVNDKYTYNTWNEYLHYLQNWIVCHKNETFADMSPASFDEWYDNENQSE